MDEPHVVGYVPKLEVPKKYFELNFRTFVLISAYQVLGLLDYHPVTVRLNEVFN